MCLLAKGLGFSLMFGRTALASCLERKRKMLATGGLVVWNPIAAWLRGMGVRFCVSYKGQDNELGSCMQREGCFSYSMTNQLALRHT